MIDILKCSEEILSHDAYVTRRVSIDGGEYLLFENSTSLGFVFVYKDTNSLLSFWSQDSEKAIKLHQFQLRKSGMKAWNAYVVLLASDVADFAASVALSAIEENLIGTRKIARSGIVDADELAAALLPLLSIRSAPHLEAIDISVEIRQRTTELSPRVVDAFLSEASEAVVMQVLEEAQ